VDVSLPVAPANVTSFVLCTSLYWANIGRLWNVTGALMRVFFCIFLSEESPVFGANISGL
jgi:hypothetical protein